jgi:hypothetical protein
MTFLINRHLFSSRSRPTQVLLKYGPTAFFFNLFFLSTNFAQDLPLISFQFDTKQIEFKNLKNATLTGLVQNNSEDDITIVSVNTNCGCVKPEAKFPFTVKSKTSAILSFPVNRPSGNQTRNITAVLTLDNGIVLPAASCTVTDSISPSIEPRALTWDSANDTQTRFVFIKNLNINQIDSIELSGDGYKIESQNYTEGILAIGVSAAIDIRRDVALMAINIKQNNEHEKNTMLRYLVVLTTKS